MESDGFKLILKNYEFLIPNFKYLSDVNQEIYEKLMANKQYEVKSNVSENVFQSFINHWIKKELPNINTDNLLEYIQLSQEFDRMKDLVEIFKRNSSIIKKNAQLKQKISDKIESENEITVNYQQIIRILRKSRIFEMSSEFFEYSDKLYKKCLCSDINEISILVLPKVKIDGIKYVINEEEKSAYVYKNCCQTSDIFIPPSIEYKSEKFIVTRILSYAFSCSEKLNSIIFSPDSEIKTFGTFAFNCCNLDRIELPPSLVELEENWLGRLPKIDIEIMPGNSHFIKYENKFILGKTDQKSEVFDVLVYSLIDEENIEIPSFIKRIGSFAFYSSDNVINVNFEEDSQLEIIESFAFANCSVVAIFIPQHVKEIQYSAFAESNLEYIEFDENCELTSIGAQCFFDSKLNEISFPSHLKSIDNDAFYFCRLEKVEFPIDSEFEFTFASFTNCKISSLIIPSSMKWIYNDWDCLYFPIYEIKIIPTSVENIINYNEFILGKSDSYSDVFDILIHANPDINQAIIPYFVEEIAPGAFCNCEKLEKIEFEENSHLQSIGKWAFASTIIKEIKIPDHVTLIDKYSFFSTEYLKVVEFSSDSEIKIIEKNSFSQSAIEHLIIPSSILELKNNWRNEAIKLENITVIPSKERNIMSFDNKFIIGKSDLKSDNFDVLLVSLKNSNEFSIPSFIKYIAPFAFEGFKKAIKINFQETSEIISVGKYAFSNSTIEEITLPSKIKVIGKGAFNNCKIKHIELPENLNIIKKSLFNMSDIESILIPDKVSEIDDYAFSYCDQLKSIIFSEKSELKFIGKNAFYESSLKKIYFPRRLAKIGKSAFKNCQLETVEFAEYFELREIQKNAFFGTKIKSIIISPHVVFIGDNAFDSCEQLDIIEIDENSELEALNFDECSAKVIMIPAKLRRKL